MGPSTVPIRRCTLRGGGTSRSFRPCPYRIGAAGVASYRRSSALQDARSADLSLALEPFLKAQVLRPNPRKGLGSQRSSLARAQRKGKKKNQKRGVRGGRGACTCSVTLRGFSAPLGRSSGLFQACWRAGGPAGCTEPIFVRLYIYIYI